MVSNKFLDIFTYSESSLPAILRDMDFIRYKQATENPNQTVLLVL